MDDSARNRYTPGDVEVITTSLAQGPSRRPRRLDAFANGLQLLWANEAALEPRQSQRKLPLLSHELPACSGPISVSETDAAIEKDSPYFVGMTNDFAKAIKSIDRKLQGRILDALRQISLEPVTPKGDTVKPLKGDLEGLWRFRIGDFRLIYQPRVDQHQVLLVHFLPRGAAYD